MAGLKILVVNAGSTSLKLSVVEDDESSSPVASLAEAPDDVPRSPTASCTAAPVSVSRC